MNFHAYGFVRRNRRCQSVQIEFNTIRHELLDQKIRLSDGRHFRVCVDRHAPGAEHGCWFQRKRSIMPAQRGVIADNASVFHAVGARVDESQRQGFDGLCTVISCECCAMNRLTSAIDATFRPGKDIQRAGRCSSRHATI